MLEICKIKNAAFKLLFGKALVEFKQKEVYLMKYLSAFSRCVPDCFFRCTEILFVYALYPAVTLCPVIFQLFYVFSAFTFFRDCLTSCGGKTVSGLFERE